MSGIELTGAEARRERNRKEMRTAILQEARKIVTEQGMDRLSMRAIARNLGYSPGALYEYYRDKEAVLHGLYFDGTEGLGMVMAQALERLPAGTSAVEALKEMGRAYRAHALEQSELYRLTFGVSSRPVHQPDDAYEREGRGGFTHLVREVERGVAAGELIAMPPEVVSLSAWSLVHGFVALEISGHIPDGSESDTEPASDSEARQFRDAAFEGVLHAFMSGVAGNDRADDMTAS